MDEKLWIPLLNLREIGTEYAKVTNGSIEKAKYYTTVSAPGFFYSRNVVDEPVEDVEALIDSIKSQAKGGKTFLTSFTKEIMPEKTAELFVQNGFKEYFVQKGMIFEPDTPLEKTVDPHIFSVDAEEIAAWIDCMLDGFVEEGKTREDANYESMINNPNLKFFIYREDGENKGTILLNLSDGYSGIHEVAVPKNFRGRRISAAMVRHVLQEIEKSGREGATLQASPLGFPVYKKLGFNEAGDIYTMYL